MKLLKIKNNILYLIVTAFLGCDLTDDRLIIQNNTNSDLFYIIKPDCEDILLNSKEILDISFESRKSSENYLHSFNGKISANDMVHIVSFGSWGGYVENGCNQQLFIYFITNKEMEKIKNQKETIDFLYCKKKFNLNKLDSLDWKVEIDEKDIPSRKFKAV